MRHKANPTNVFRNTSKTALQLGADYMAYYMFARIERYMRLLRKFHNFEGNCYVILAKANTTRMSAVITL
jgi:hypothetical protein